jgi:alkanesulfonate monooxygenase SsuD/methylene tetrahydromethanopterin reductase-like flavin-dependent oxidoreductase (luciferase family)
MLGLNVIAAESDEEAKLLFTSIQQAFANLRLGRPGKMPPPVENLQLDPMVQAGIAQALSCSVVGGPEKVREGVKAFVERTGADELMVTGSIWDHTKRKRSFEIAAMGIG